MECKSRQRPAPPWRGPAIARGAERRVETPRFDQIAHALSDNPVVTGESDGSAVQHPDQPLPSFLYGTRLGLRWVVGSAVCEPVTEAPDVLVAVGDRVAGALR